MSTTAKKTTAKKAPVKKTATKKAPAKKAVPVTPPTGASSPQDFKKKKKAVSTLTLPSELRITARRVDLQALVVSGNVPNALMPIVQEALDKGQKADVKDMVAPEGEVDMKMVEEMYGMVEEIIVACVVDPQVHEKPKTEDDRDDDLLYVDELEEEDKMFIFNWSLGGTDDVATFREQAGADMDALEQGQVPILPAK